MTFIPSLFMNLNFFIPTQYLEEGSSEHQAKWCQEREVSDACLQYWGGMGFTWKNYVSRVYRDCRLASIGGGADEVMLGIISKLMGTFPKD